MVDVGAGGRPTRGLTSDGVTRVRVHAACPPTNLAIRTGLLTAHGFSGSVRCGLSVASGQVGGGVWRVRRHRRGFTLIEMMLGAAILVIALVALIGAFLGQSILNTHARSLTGAMNDATRVMEQIRAQNTGAACAAAPAATVPAATGVGTCTPPLVSWDDWLQRCGGGKSLPNPTQEELVVVTCRDEDGGALDSDYCGRLSTPGPPVAPAQVSAGEWRSQPPPGPGVTSFNPIQVTVAICWRSRGRVIGECVWNQGPQRLQASDGGNGPNTQAGVIDSPAMLTTLMTCRGG